MMQVLTLVEVAEHYQDSVYRDNVLNIIEHYRDIYLFPLSHSPSMHTNSLGYYTKQ